MKISPEGPYTTFLPDFCGTRIVFIVVMLAELLALILTLAHYPVLSEFFYELALYSLFIQLTALSCTLALCLSRPYMNHLGNTIAAAMSYLVTILVCLLVTEISWWGFNQFGMTVFRTINHTEFLLRIKFNQNQRPGFRRCNPEFDRIFSLTA
jgi:two-component system sensor histidine kinase AlgZ